MQYGKWSGLAFATAVLACAGAAPVLAENAWIEEVTVLSTRSEQAVADVPAAVSVIGQDDIQLGRQQLGLDESLTRVPGLFAQNRYNFSQDLRLAIRGFGARANFGIRGIKIYVDDIPATTADGQSGVDDIDLSSLNRIEVTRGPFSSLYGSSAGGVLQLYSETGTEPGMLSADIVAGEDGYHGYRLKAIGQVSDVAYMLSANRLDYDGYRDHSAVEATQFNSTLRWEIDAQSSLTVVANVVDSPVAQDAGAITAAQAAQDPTQAQSRNVSSDASEAVEQQRLGLVYRRGFGDGHELRLRNYYVWRDFEAFLPIGTHIPFVADDGVVEFDRFFYGGGAQVLLQSSLFGRPHRFTTGFDIDLQQDDRQRYLNNAGSRGALTFDQLEEAQSYGLYMRSELDLSDAFTVVAGLRYDDIELEVDDRFLANADQSATLDFDEVSPMLGLLWGLGDNTTIYANYGTSFETPTFTELASPARDLDVSLGGFANVKAQQARSVELGIRSVVFDQRLALEAAVYHMRVEDEITNVENIGSRSFFENADTRRRGFEFGAVAALSDTLRGTLAYTYADYEFADFPADPAVQSNQLPGLPEHQAFVELRYDNGRGFYTVIDALYVDELMVDNANSDATDASVVANLRAGYEWRSGAWRIAPYVGVNNLFDEEYMSNVRINGFGGRLYEPGPERNFYAGVTLRRVTD